MISNHIVTFSWSMTMTGSLALPKKLIVFSLLKWAFYMFWIDLRVQPETTLLGCGSTTFRRGEMYCFHIICGVNSSTLHLTELFWWFESQDQGVFGSSTSISKKVILWWIYIIEWVLGRGGTSEKAFTYMSLDDLK